MRFRTVVVGCVALVASLLSASATADPLPETRFFFHPGGESVNQADKIFGDGPFFDSVAPTGDQPSFAADTSILINTAPGGIGDPTWSGEVDGIIETITLEFWQKPPLSEPLSAEAHYQLRMFLDNQVFEFPLFEKPSEISEPFTKITHTYTPENSDGILPLDASGRTVTIGINGWFLVNEAATIIAYDSVDTPSGFSVNVPQRAPFPPDVDDPPGLQEVLASDPDAGWTSRSEPHIAQSPLDPDILVAGSKFYNLDPDVALPEYEFKIGTYVSFDRGQTWSDLGQLATCPLSDAPASSWPNNTCYPEDDPTRAGDLGEEYITSDVWVQFDDEGNAYAMVLDHPPFDGAGEGAGWGMTLHRWESVSPEDLTTGDTWSGRIPINSYPDELERDDLGFLDDKNTLAVNNAGPDGDGETGILIACWGQNISTAIKQQQVCKRSTDGGQTWPGDPVPISGVHQLVIGVHVVADRTDPETFYAVWNQYGTGGAAGDIGGELTPSTLDFNITTDGGQTWLPQPVPIATLNGVPRTFPGQDFRNLSIPIMDVAPNGDLYVVYAEYVDATDPASDEDGKEADILLLRSTNGGVTWDGPMNISEEPAEPDINVNADQFQPYVSVTETGQVNVFWFDRRWDPDNFFVDSVLVRSNDGGQTWSAPLRLSHDATDPEFNAPRPSATTLFFGDYQGLVADDCFAIPFVNDTHLANDDFLDPGPVRDPDFDEDIPSSSFLQYQQAVNWLVPNTEEFGGANAELPAECGDAEPPPPPPPME